MPAAAEILRLDRLLHDVEQEGKAVDALHEGIMVGLAEAGADIHQILRREILVADRDHLVIEERLVDLRPRMVVHGSQVDTADFGAKRSCDRGDFDRAVLGHGRHHPALGGHVKRV